MDSVVRPARWPADECGIAALDFSYTTDRVYRLERDALSFRLIVEPLEAPRRRVFPPFGREMAQLRAMQHVVVAEVTEDDDNLTSPAGIVGLVAANVEAWNRRVRVEHLVVALPVRGRGIGRALMDSAVAFARARGAWCVWLETQAENYAAVEFYRRIGFRLCGLDECLYDPTSSAAGEHALFLALDMSPEMSDPPKR